MPSLAGLFSRKSKSTQSSPNVYQNNVAASSSKLRLPFSRKKPSTSSTSLLPPSITSASDSPIDHRRLRPPPSKSAIFAAYADPQIALSTRSLPPSPLPTPPPQKSSFFQWGSKSTPSTPHYIKKSDSPTEEKSFNLKAFRHISNNSDISLNQGPPRPRGTSITSESSQRISVAAFREVQARRSTTDSPVPSFRATSPTKPDPKRRSSNLALTSESDDGSSSREEDDDPSDDDNDDDDDDDLSRHGRIKPRLGIYRKRTVTRSKLGDGDTRFRATKSESGHASISHVQAWRSHSFVPSPAITPSSSSHDEKTQIQNPTRELPEPQQRSQSSLGFTTRQRASISVSAVLPSAAAKRASAVVTKGESKKEGDDPRKPNFGGPSTIPNPSHPSIPIPTHKHAPSTSTSTITADSDSDNAPLALLMQPRRPGSALSHISNARSTSSNKPKPLIDISELTGNTMRKGKGKAKENDVAFTGGATLISAGPSSILGEAVGGRVLSSSPTQMSPPLAFSVSPPTKFVSPPASPVREARELPPGEYSVKSQEQHVGKREAPISERLSRIVQSSVGGGSGSDPNANANANTHTKPLLLPRLHLDRGPPTSEPTTPPRLSPPDQGLADILGGSVRLISREGESESEGEGEGEGGVGRGRVLEMGIGSGSSKGKEKEKEKEATTKRSPTKLRKKSPPMGKGGSSRSKSLPLSLAQVSDVNVGSERERERENERENERGREREDRIAPPIPIKQRAPTPSFSVTSRPVRSNLSSPTTPTTPGSLSFSGGGDVDQGQGQRQSITTMVSNSSSPVAAPSRPGSGPGASVNMNMNVNRGERQRSSTLLNGPVVLGSVSSTTSSATATAATATTTTALKGVSSASPATGKPAMSKSSAASPMAKSPTSTSTPTPTPPAPAPTQAPAPAPPPAPPPLTAPTPRSSSSSSSSLKTGPPPKPFAAGTALKRESPASSTGDSSSGRVPFTPRDGSEVESASASASASEGPRRVGVGVLRHGKRWSVSFEDELGVGGGVGGKGREREVDVGSDVEERRRERRRGEARAAIELGNVINGRGPIIDEDDDEDDLPINQTMSGARMSAVNPMMGMGGAQMPFGGTSPSWNPNSNLNMNPNMTPWQMQMQMQMNPQIPIPMPFMNMNMPMNPNPNPNPNPNLNPSPNTPGVDPSFILAHQQAMMYAKQAYQMAVAQQAMAAAGDEWERGSSIGGFGGGGSVYGGGAPGFGMSVGMGGGMGMGGGTGMGMGGGMGNGWSTSSVIFPPSSRSMYAGGFSGARSEYGGGVGGGGGGGGGGVGGGGGAWSSSRSSYGEFGGGKGGAAKSGMVGTGGQRNSGLYPPIPQGNAGGGGPNVGRATPRSRTASQPANVGRGVRRTPPPSSWKAGV